MRIAKKIILTSLVSFALSSCAYTAQVERMGVEYNTALADMNNEQTLLNILRARDGMPVYFTSVSQFRGMLSVTGNAGVGSQLRGSSQSATNSTAITTAPAPTSTTTVVGATPSSTTVVGSAVDSTVQTTTSVLGNGVDVFTPQISGSIMSGTNFDVDVFDSQNFFQGISGSIPLSTIETLLHRGVDERVLMALLIARIDIQGLSEDGTQIPIRDSLENDPNDPSAIKNFLNFIECVDPNTIIEGARFRPLVPISRVRRTTSSGETSPYFSLEDLAVLDGESFELSNEDGTAQAQLSNDHQSDEDIYLATIRERPRIIDLVAGNDPSCFLEKARNGVVIRGVNANYLSFRDGDSRGFISRSADQSKDAGEPISIELVFRSPEGLYRYLGSYLANYQDDNDEVRNEYEIGEEPIFTLTSGLVDDPLVSARYRGQYWSLTNSNNVGTRNAQVFTILQQMINLHKDASETPSVIPVRAIP